MQMNVVVVLCLILSGCSMVERSSQIHNYKISTPSRATYGKVVKLQAMNNQYVAESGIEGSLANTVQYTLKLFDENLITINSQSNHAMLTDCIEIHYNDQGVIKIDVVHGDYCIRIN